MNIIIWNCRGVSGKGFASLVKDLTFRHKVSFLCLLETHIGGEKAKKIVKRFNFDSCYIMDRVGFGGGIWCMWNKEVWQVDVVSSHIQYVHMKVKFEQNDPWFLTIVYGSPQPATRRDLWEGLRAISVQIDGEWCVRGDFNSVLSSNDTGGSSNLSSDHSLFKNCLFDCGLYDIGFNSQPFT